MYTFQRQFDKQEQALSPLIPSIDRNPRRYVNMQVVYIASSVVMLIVGILRIVKPDGAAYARDLAFGIAWITAGVIGVFVGFQNVNFAVKRLQAKIDTDPGSGEIPRSSIASRIPL